MRPFFPLPKRVVELPVGSVENDRIGAMKDYEVGDVLEFNGHRGKVVPNVKMPGDICVQWDEGTFSSYDKDFLDTHTKNLGKELVLNKP